MKAKEGTLGRIGRAGGQAAPSRLYRHRRQRRRYSGWRGGGSWPGRGAWRLRAEQGTAAPIMAHAGWAAGRARAGRLALGLRAASPLGSPLAVISRGCRSAATGRSWGCPARPAPVRGAAWRSQASRWCVRNQMETFPAHRTGERRPGGGITSCGAARIVGGGEAGACWGTVAACACTLHCMLTLVPVQCYP